MGQQVAGSITPHASIFDLLHLGNRLKACGINLTCCQVKGHSERHAGCRMAGRASAGNHARAKTKQ
jgi:hypothetical protein